MLIIPFTIIALIVLIATVAILKFIFESMAIYQDFACSVELKPNGAKITASRGLVYAKYWAEKGSLGYQLTLTEDMHEAKVLLMPAKRMQKLMRDSLADYIQQNHPEIQIVEIMSPR